MAAVKSNQFHDNAVQDSMRNILPRAQDKLDLGGALPPVPHEKKRLHMYIITICMRMYIYIYIDLLSVAVLSKQWS